MSVGVRRRASIIPSTSRTIESRALVTSGLCGAASATTPTAIWRPISSTSSAMSEPNSDPAVIVIVSLLISPVMSTTSPESASRSHRSSMVSVASVIEEPRAFSRSRWNAGCISRRSRRQSAPSSVSRPSATTILKVSLMNVPFE